MGKLDVRDVAECVGKCVVRGVVNVGVNVAVIGGGLFGTMLYAGACTNPVLRTAVTVIGSVGSMAAGYVVADLVDDKLVEIGLDVDGI